MNLTPSFVNHVEQGMKMPGLTTILKLAHAVAATPSELLSDFTPEGVRRLLG